MTIKKPKVGQRVRWKPTEGMGTITEVSPSGNRVQVKWDEPDPDSGEGETQHNIAPHMSLRLL